MTTTIKPTARPLTQAEQYERAAQHLRQSAQSLSGLSTSIPNTAYWEWDQENATMLPLDFARWLTTQMATLLERRVRELRGEA